MLRPLRTSNLELLPQAVAPGPGAAPGGGLGGSDPHRHARVVEGALHVLDASRAAHVPLSHARRDWQPRTTHARPLHDLGPALDQDAAVTAVRVVDAEGDAGI